MQAISQHRDATFVPLGRRRKIPGPNDFVLDLSRVRENSDSTPDSGNYPSPPMSGSPPHPPKATRESAEASQGNYQQSSQDVYRGIPAIQGGIGLPTGATVPGRLFAGEVPERVPFPLPRPEAAARRPVSYPQHSQHSQAVRHQHSFIPTPGPAPAQASASYVANARPVAPENVPQTSPRVQRKTKGHVASACVPCKKAHLRCDARRPCSRCMSNGKGDACIDVQHKKRGRPRLRDDRESRYDSAGFSSPQDAGVRRPVSLYGASTSTGTAFGEGLGRSQSQSYRVLKSQPPDPTNTRFPERGSMADVNIMLPAPLSISTRLPEPAAFLTMNLDIAKASATFADALARPNIEGLKLIDVVAPRERAKVLGRQRQIQEEQKMREPTYLPPIFGKEKEDQVIRALGFSQEEVSRYPLSRQDSLVFTTSDGQERKFPVRMGLAKQESIYFVVVLLNLAARQPQPPTPSPNPRDLPYSYQPVSLPYSQPTPMSATFDPRQSRMGDAGYGPRQLEAPAQVMPAGLSPGAAVPSYAASPSRPDYPTGQPSYQIPRSELLQATRPMQAPGYQLPPIRNQQQQAPPPPQTDQSPEGRDDRGGRVDIGGLIDRSPSSRSRP